MAKLYPEESLKLKMILSSHTSETQEQGFLSNRKFTVFSVLNLFSFLEHDHSFSKVHFWWFAKMSEFQCLCWLKMKDILNLLLLLNLFPFCCHCWDLQLNAKEKRAFAFEEWGVCAYLSWCTSWSTLFSA